MSEYQYVSFRAIDNPVSDKNLEYMGGQSSRAEITRWSFENEYHYGDFHGNAVEMLRRGYDIHLHYANFGTRRLMIRLPSGLPDEAVGTQYLVPDGFSYIPDKSGPGGILEISPCYETPEPIFDLDELIDQLAPLRAEIMNGDLRPLYIAHLAVSHDENHGHQDPAEVPIPAGLGTLTEAQQALAYYLEAQNTPLNAIAVASPPAPKAVDFIGLQAEWLRTVPPARKEDWLIALMGDSGSSVKAEMTQAFRKSQKIPAWPTVHLTRSLDELQAVADERRRKAIQVAQKKEQQKRLRYLAKLSKDPEAVIRKTTELVKQRGTSAYEEAATLLADLRESLAGTANSGLAEKQAEKLAKANPTLKTLTSALRKQGFIPKKK